MYSKNYLNWVKEEKERCDKMKVEFTSLTSGQHKFAEWCFDNYKQLQRFGDMERVFGGVSKFIKHSDKFIPPTSTE